MPTRQDDSSSPLPFFPDSYGPGRRQFDFVEYSRDLTALASNHLRTNVPSAAAAATRAVHEQAEAVLKAYPEERALVACAAGCSHCCIMNVAVLAPEAVAIAEHLQQTLAPEQRLALQGKLQELNAATAATSHGERLALQLPCAFLDERGYCAIHPVRPLLCRRATSIDPRDCRRALERQGHGEEVPIVADLFHERLFEEAFLALARALEERGLSSASGRLSEEVLRRLED